MDNVRELRPKPKTSVHHLKALLFRWLREDVELAISKIVTTFASPEHSAVMERATEIITRGCKIQIVVTPLEKVDEEQFGTLVFAQVHKREQPASASIAVLTRDKDTK